MSLKEIWQERRSFYSLGKNVQLSNEELEAMIAHYIKFCPSAFNSQSARTVLLLGANHLKLWDIVKEELSRVNQGKLSQSSLQKINAFAQAYGTVLFFEDENVVADLQKRFSLYADNFPKWALQANGMLEVALWCAFKEAGLGASLQHYNPLIDACVWAEWNLPESWKLVAQMPFGSIENEAGEKTFEALDNRFKIFK